jgi:hypothetical protein
MFAATRFLCVLTLAVLASAVRAADLPKDSPFQQAGNATSAAAADPLEFAGVSTVGKKTMINLYDRQLKHGFWVEVGATTDGVTVVKYDSAHDQITVRRNGVEKMLPLRAASNVANGPAVAIPVVAPAPSDPPAPAPVMTGNATTVDPVARTRARQEEEARMLVSDLLEIGMAQRKAYEEAQRRNAAGQPAPAPGTPATPPAAVPPPEAAPAVASPTQAAAPETSATSSGG